MGNRLKEKNDIELEAFARGLVAAAELRPGVFNLNPTLLSGATQGADAIGTAVADQVSAMSLHKSATEARASGRASLTRALNRIVDVAYGSEATDADLASIGLAPRRTKPSRPVAPSTVKGVRAVPDAQGGLAVSFSKAGNRDSTIYLVETSPDGAAWTQIFATSRSRVRLSGFAPGVGAWLRIVASNSLGMATPSDPVAIYTPSLSASPLRLAA